MMPTIEDTLAHVRSQVQVNAPLAMLLDGYLELFLERGLNPEIGLDAAILDRCAPEAMQSVADALKRSGRSITLHGPFIDLAPGSRDTAIRQVSRRRLDLLASAADIFRPLTVVCHCGYDWRRYGYFRDEWTDRTIDAWRRLADRLAPTGARLVLENVYERGPEEALPVITALAEDGVGWCLDIGHANVFGECGIGHWLETLGPYIGEVHLHDNDGDADDHHALGSGAIDLPSVFRFFASRAADRPVLTLEPHGEADLEPSLIFLARHWPWPTP
jgi:sugar phosphate isomerase/epimerase